MICRDTSPFLIMVCRQSFRCSEISCGVVDFLSGKSRIDRDPDDLPQFPAFLKSGISPWLTSRDTAMAYPFTEWTDTSPELGGFFR
jgi:hypothetical protein